MSLDLAKTLADAAAPLDAAGNVVQGLVRSVPKPIRNVLDGVWFGNPLHPALTDVPVGAWTAAMLLDLAGSESADAALAVGVLGAVPAAVTGTNDWSYLRGEEKRIGMVHALLNISAVLLNTGSLVARRSGNRDLGRVLSGVAFGGTLLSAHLGGLLSFGFGVRVNRTAFERPRDRFLAVLDESELDGGKLRKVDLEGVPVLVARAERTGEICAIAHTCTHLGGPLADGTREGDTVICPWHGSRFDLCTGEVLDGPAVFPEPRFEARVRGGKVEVRAAKDE